MKGFPFITAGVCLLVGTMFSTEIKTALKDIPVLGDLLNKTSNA